MCDNSKRIYCCSAGRRYVEVGCTVTKFDIVVKFELASIALLVGKIDEADVPDASELAARKMQMTVCHISWVKIVKGGCHACYLVITSNSDVPVFIFDSVTMALLSKCI